MIASFFLQQNYSKDPLSPVKQFFPFPNLSPISIIEPADSTHGVTNFTHVQHNPDTILPHSTYEENEAPSSVLD